MTRVFINSEEDAKKMGISKGEWELMKMEDEELPKSSSKKTKKVAKRKTKNELI